MPRRAPIALLLSVAALVIFSPPASAIPIHHHVTTYDVAYVPDAHGYRDKVRIPHEKVIVYDVAPPDSDDDGCPDDSDSFVGPGCNPPPPPPEPAPAPIESVPAPAPVVTTTGSGCVGMEAESGSAGYDAMSPTGYIGCYQISPDHFTTGSCAGLGTDPAGQDACAAIICQTEGAGAWTNPAGENPCGRLGG